MNKIFSGSFCQEWMLLVKLYNKDSNNTKTQFLSSTILWMIEDNTHIRPKIQWNVLWISIIWISGRDLIVNYGKLSEMDIEEE